MLRWVEILRGEAWGSDTLRWNNMETDGEYRLQVKVGVKNTLRRAGVSV